MNNLSVDQLSQHIELIQHIPGFPYQITKSDVKTLVDLEFPAAWMIEINPDDIGKVIPTNHTLAQVDDWYRNKAWVAGEKLSFVKCRYATTICGYSCYSTLSEGIDMIPEEAEFNFTTVESDHPDDVTTGTVRIHLTLDQINSMTPGELSVMMDCAG